MVIDEKTLEAVVQLLIKIPNRAIVRTACQENLKIPAINVDAAIAEARKRITLAADYHRDEELGKAIVRYDNIYSDAYKIKDHKTALAAENSRVKLLRLDKPQVLDGTDAADRSDVLGQLIRDYLEPLGLAPAETPVEELLRLAALKIVEAKSFEALTYAATRPKQTPGPDAAPESGKFGDGSGNRIPSADPESGASDPGQL